MANQTDPNASALLETGTDPQNKMEYITRQKIYDSRYWKEDCFGLSVNDVLLKAATSLQCIGGLPTRFLSLLLKLLQLHPETELINETFIEQEDFKYVRALGCLYIRLMGRPAEVYETLEPLYRDSRKVRCYEAPVWTLLHLDEFIHILLTETQVCGITLPRLPSRRTLQEAGYLPDGQPRVSALQDVLLGYDGGCPIAYLKHKALVEQSPAALVAWSARQERLGLVTTTTNKKKDTTSNNNNNNTEEGEVKVTTRHRRHHHDSDDDDDSDHLGTKKKKRRTTDDDIELDHNKNSDDDDDHDNDDTKEEKKEKKKSKKNKKEYSNLFKTSSAATQRRRRSEDDDNNTHNQQQQQQQQSGENSVEYWNEQRAKLGLKPLQKGD